MRGRVPGDTRPSRKPRPGRIACGRGKRMACRKSRGLTRTSRTTTRIFTSMRTATKRRPSCASGPRNGSQWNSVIGTLSRAARTSPLRFISASPTTRRRSSFRGSNIELKESSKGKLVFESRKNPGHPILDLKKAFNAALKNAGIDNLRFHDLLRTGGTRLSKSRDTKRDVRRVPALLPDRRYAFVPPSTVRLAPVMYPASELATKATSAATSSTWPYRLSAVLAN